MPAVDRRLIQNFEWPLLGVTLLIVAIGIVNLISAAPGQEAGIPATAWRQLTWLGLGMVGMLGAVAIDYRHLERGAALLYVVTLALLVAVLIFAPVIKGSQRWILFGVGRLQPSELAKLSVVVVLARILYKRTSTTEMRLRELVVPALLIAIPIGLVLRQPDLGTAMLLALLAGTYLLFSRVRVGMLVWMSVAAFAAAGGAWLFYLHDYQKARLLTFLDPEGDPLGAAYHAIQSQIAVGSGGLLGKGFLRGSQSQLDFLPEQQTDFVFSVLAEEWGFIGGVVVLGLYLALFLRGLLIARASKDLFGSYLSIGVIAMLFWPCVINLAMVLGLAPVVGIALPLLSYGGSALITSMIGIGLLMNVSMRRYVF